MHQIRQRQHIIVRIRAHCRQEVDPVSCDECHTATRFVTAIHTKSGSSKMASNTGCEIQLFDTDTEQALWRKCSRDRRDRAFYEETRWRGGQPSSCTPSGHQKKKRPGETHVRYGMTAGSTRQLLHFACQLTLYYTMVPMKKREVSAGAGASCWF